MAYIRALQLSQSAAAADVPAGQKVPSEPLQFQELGSGATLPVTESKPAREESEMSSAPAHNLDLMAPPVVKTIQQRSLLVGLGFGVIVAIGAWRQPEQFFRAYLMAFMAWLGVTLGSMAILMLRHLTKGAWGMVIRRILGAAMRCSPLMALLVRAAPVRASQALYLGASP